VLVLAASCAALVCLRGSSGIVSANPAESTQLDYINVVPPPSQCSKTEDNCLETKCCKVTGLTCYEVHSGYAKCMKWCTPGVNGTCLTHAHYAPALKSTLSKSSTTLFCWSFYTADRGSATKPSYELKLLRTNLFLGTSIFGCEAWKVYSDVETWLNNKENTVKVEDKDGIFHYAQRKKTGTWVNAGIFLETWKVIRDGGLWATKDWTVKVDADAVFLPARLRAKLAKQPVTNNGIYLENCKYVNYGFFGNLEVFSHHAIATYLGNLDNCKSVLNWKGSEKDTGYQPWGEDLFAQICMDLTHVDKVTAYDITTDGACEAYRPDDEKKNKKWQPDCSTTFTAALHPFKKPNEYFECLRLTQKR